MIERPKAFIELRKFVDALPTHDRYEVKTWKKVVYISSEYFDSIIEFNIALLMPVCYSWDYKSNVECILFEGIKITSINAKNPLFYI